MKADGIARVLGLELNALADGRFSCRFYILSKKSDSLIIEKKGIVTDTFDKLWPQLPKDLPTALVMTGRGIIHKNLSAQTESPPDLLFSSAFPSIDQKQFYIQVYQQDGAALVSIARKEEIDSLLSKLTGIGLMVLMVSLGAMVSEVIWVQLDSQGEEIRFDGHSFTVSAQKQFASYRFDGFQINGSPIQIGQEQIPEECVIAYAAAFQLLLHLKVDPIIADIPSVKDLFAKFLANAKLKNMAMVFLVALFASLLVSFCVFTYYNGENMVLLKEVGSQTASEDQTELLAKSIAENGAALKRLNWANGYNYGYLINEIGHSLPRQLTLTNISVNPFKTEEEKALRVPIIAIAGFTDNLTALNNWIFVLKEKKWTKTVKLVKYQEDEESESYQFNLLINY